MTSRRSERRAAAAGSALQRLGGALVRRCGRVGLQARLTLTHGLCVVPLVVLIGVALHLQRRDQLAQGLAFAERTAEHLAAEQATILDQARDALVRIAEAAPLAELGRRRCDLELADIVASNDWATNAALLMPDSTVRCHSAGARAPASYAGWAFWRQVREADGVAVSGLLVSKVTGLPILVAAMPLRDPAGRLAGMAAIALEPEGLVKHLLTRLQGVGLVAMLIDGEGNLVTRNPVSPFVGLSIASSPLAGWALAGPREATRLAALDGVERLYVQRPVAGTGLRVVVGIDDGQAIADIRRQGLLAALAVLATLALSALVAGTSSAAFVLRDARRMAQAAESGQDLARVELGRAAAPELRALHEANRAMAERLRDHAEASSDWLWETDAEHRFTAFSERFEEVLGIAPARLLGRRRWDGRSGDPADGDWEAYIRTVEARLPFRDFTYAIRDDAGKRRVLRVSGRPAFDASGAFAGYRGVGRDVTAEHALEQDLARTRRLLADALDSMADGLVFSDAEGRELLENRRMGEIFPGVRRGTTGIPVRETVRALALAGAYRGVEAGDVDRWVAEHFRLTHSEAGHEFQLADGRWIHEIARPAAGGGTVAVLHDVTARRQAEQALAAAAAHMRAVLDTLVDSVITIDGSGTIQSVNPAVARMFGYRAEEVVGRNVSMLMPEPHRSAHDGYLRRYLATGESRLIGRHRALEAQRADGSLFPIELTVAPMRLDGRAMFVGIIRDTTERRRVEQLKAEFISTVSHELRTPLTSIVGSLALIGGGAVGEIPPRARRMVEIAHKNGERLVHLVNDILDLEKLESGRMELHLEPVRLESALEQAVEANRPYADKHGVALRLGERAAGTALVDQHRFQQVLANLISNAVKFSPAGGEVTLGLAREDGDLVVSVKDRGRGIPDEFKGRIFGRFAQADASDTREKGGSGLGLSITKSIVERLGGRIDFASELGVGTTFFVRLPARPEGASARARVLVCEADAGAAGRLRAVLERNGFSVDVASGPEVACEGVAAGAYAAVTLGLPEPGKADIAQSLRDTEPPAVIVLSTDAAGLEAGAASTRPAHAQGACVLRSIASAVQRQDDGPARVLHVEDDPDIAAVVAAALGEGDVVVSRAASLAEAAAALAGDAAFDLAVLDVGLPDGSGLDLLDLLVGEGGTPKVPTIIFSAQEVPESCRSRVAATLIKSRASLCDLAGTVRAVIAAHRLGHDEPLGEGERLSGEAQAERGEAWQSCSA